MRELEAGWIILAIVAEAAGQPDECAVQPPGRIKVLLLHEVGEHITFVLFDLSRKDQQFVTAQKAVSQGWGSI
jgi:hypothetical protein